MLNYKNKNKNSYEILETFQAACAEIIFFYSRETCSWVIEAST